MTTPLPEPAFPTTESNGCNSGAPGMTLRDYFAAKAIGNCEGAPKRIAQMAYEIADAMLAERAK